MSPDFAPQWLTALPRRFLPSSFGYFWNADVCLPHNCLGIFLCVCEWYVPLWPTHVQMICTKRTFLWFRIWERPIKEGRTDHAAPHREEPRPNRQSPPRMAVLPRGTRRSGRRGTFFDCCDSKDEFDWDEAFDGGGVVASARFHLWLILTKHVTRKGWQDVLLHCDVQICGESSIYMCPGCCQFFLLIVYL